MSHFKSPFLNTPDGTWKILEICVRPAELCTSPCDDWTVRCEIEVQETTRQYWRGFILYYYPEFFEMWDWSEEDFSRVAFHAKRWVSTYLTSNSHRIDYSIGDNVIRAEIRF